MHLLALIPAPLTVTEAWGTRSVQRGSHDPNHQIHLRTTIDVTLFEKSRELCTLHCTVKSHVPSRRHIINRTTTAPHRHVSFHITITLLISLITRHIISRIHTQSHTKTDGRFTAHSCGHDGWHVQLRRHTPPEREHGTGAVHAINNP